MSVRRIPNSLILLPVAAALALGSTASLGGDLLIAPSGDSSVRLTWPSSRDSWVFEAADRLDNPLAWDLVSDAPTLDDDTWTVDLPTRGHTGYFRLSSESPIFVDASNTEAGSGTLADPFQTIGQAEALARARFGSAGKRQVIYVFSNTYSEALLFDGTGTPGYAVALVDSSTTLAFDGQVFGGDPPAHVNAPAGQTGLRVHNMAEFELQGFRVAASNANAVQVTDTARCVLQRTGFVASNGTGADLSDIGMLRAAGLGIASTGGVYGICVDTVTAHFQADAVSVSNSARAGIHIDSANGTFLFSDGDAGTFVDATINTTGAGHPGVTVVDSPGHFSFDGVDIGQTGADGMRVADCGSLTLMFAYIDGTISDGLHVENTELTASWLSIGGDAQVGDDGIEIVNDDGRTRSAFVENGNVFGPFGDEPLNRGIFINAQTGTLHATLEANSVSSYNQAILTTDGGTSNSLVLGLSGNSPLLTRNAGRPTLECVGGGAHSTFVRAWDYPNQILGGVLGDAGGVRFDRVTFDADANPGNGYQQVDFGGELRMGAVPPHTVSRIRGDGLALTNTTGNLRIETLSIANQNGTAFLVATNGLETTFHLATSNGTINTYGGPAMVLQGLSADVHLTHIKSEHSPTWGVMIDGVSGAVAVTNWPIVYNPGLAKIVVTNSPDLVTRLQTVLDAQRPAAPVAEDR